MAIFKSVSLPADIWNYIEAALKARDTEHGRLYAELIREQLDGKLKVKANSKTVSFAAPKGGDLRASRLLRGR